MLAAGVIAVLAGTAPVLRPGTLAVSERDYPLEALAAGIEGVAAARTTIDTEGVPHDCVIVASVGNSAMDDATCRIMLRARYRPARDARHRPVEREVVKRIRWSIEANRPMPFRSEMAVVRVDFDAAGVPVACTETGSVKMLSDRICPPGNLGGLRPVLSALLDRSIEGLRSVELRISISVQPGVGPEMPADAVARNILGDAQVEIARDGHVSACLATEAKVILGTTYAMCSMFQTSNLYVPDPSAPEPRRMRVMTDAVGYPQVASPQR